MATELALFTSFTKFEFFLLNNRLGFDEFFTRKGLKANTIEKSRNLTKYSYQSHLGCLLGIAQFVSFFPIHPFYFPWRKVIDNFKPTRRNIFALALRHANANFY